MMYAPTAVMATIFEKVAYLCTGATLISVPGLLEKPRTIDWLN